jgi:hypothetical protein
MPRVSNPRPTVIYWLFDMRPETLFEWPGGRPFYCGKTVRNAPWRLSKHKRAACRTPKRPISIWLNACGENVRAQTMEVVATTGDWIEREKHWIATLRFLYPGCANVSDGGAGVLGMVRSEAARLKTSLALKGRKMSAEQRAKLSAVKKGIPTKKPSDETRAKMSASMKGKKKGRPLSEKHRANISIAQRARFAKARAA